jgi:hypothetical protein
VVALNSALAPSMARPLVEARVTGFAPVAQWIEHRSSEAIGPPLDELATARGFVGFWATMSRSRARVSRIRMYPSVSACGCRRGCRDPVSRCGSERASTDSAADQPTGIVINRQVHE